MDITYSYTKLRRNFGRQPQLCEVPVHLIDSIDPDVDEQKKYILRNPVDTSTQNTDCQSEQYVNSPIAIMANQGMQHVEGGWPRDINFMDEEQTARYKRKIERDDNYVSAVLNTYSPLKHYIHQNNAIDMYDLYFKHMPSELSVEKSLIRTNNVYRDIDCRPVSCITWTLEDDAKLVVAYCDTTFPLSEILNEKTTCYIWEIEYPNTPLTNLEPESPCWQLIPSLVHPKSFIAGLENGKVSIFDIREGNEAVDSCARHNAHRDPISALLCIPSRHNNEFFSGSSDGQCMWWDVRNLYKPIDTLIMAVHIPHGEEITLAHGEPVSSLQFDRAFPTRFLCGTDTGLVINVNRKGKTQSEIMAGTWEAHLGPVRALHRSPCTSKMFITCGDWAVRVWSDDVHYSPILKGVPHRYQLTDVAWAPVRISAYMTVSADGIFRYWDLLRKYHEPVANLKVSREELLKMKVHEEGRLIAIGDAKGSISLLSLSENLVLSGPRDKQLMVSAYERESKREHILETRVKEIKLKLKAAEEGSELPAPEEPDETLILTIAEDNYKKIITEELIHMSENYTHTCSSEKGRI